MYLSKITFFNLLVICNIRSNNFIRITNRFANIHTNAYTQPKIHKSKLKLHFSHLFLGRLAKTHKAYVLKNIHIQSIAGTCPCVECVVYGDERYPSKSCKSCPMNFIILSTKTNLPQQQNAS